MTSMRVLSDLSQDRVLKECYKFDIDVCIQPVSEEANY